jgi:hypothetical protein
MLPMLVVKILPKMNVNINKGCYIIWGSIQWKRISRKQGTRWQHLSRLKLVSSSLCKKDSLVVKYSNLYLRLVTPSGG